MGDTKEADATAEFSYTNDIDKPVKRVDGVSGNTIFIKDDSEYDTAEITAGQALLVNLTNGDVILSKQALTAIPAGNFTSVSSSHCANTDAPICVTPSGSSMSLPSSRWP